VRLSRLARAGTDTDTQVPMAVRWAPFSWGLTAELRE
jgi:hypothetical protein